MMNNSDNISPNSGCSELAKRIVNRVNEIRDNNIEIMGKKRNYTYGGDYNNYYNEPVIYVPKLEIGKKERNDSIKLMRKIFEIQSHSGENQYMSKFLIDFINGLNDKTITWYEDLSGNIYVEKGKAKTYPCIVSHIDTVHYIIPKKDYIVLNSDTEFFAVDLSARKNTGIGGDDKCGIYTCLDNLMKHEVIKCAFFVDEEIGCVGSANAIMDFFEDVSFVLQADRKGYQDVVSDIMYTEMFGVDFLEKIEETLDRYGRKICDGGMTDVMQLAHNDLPVAMANFSCGYYNPHSSNEYVIIDELILTSILFRDIIKDVYIDGEKNYFYRNKHNSGSSYYDSNGKAKGWGEYDDYSDYGGYGTALLPYSEDKKLKHNGDGTCSVCGCMTTYDVDMDLDYCNNCMDYDYKTR